MSCTCTENSACITKDKRRIKLQAWLTNELNTNNCPGCEWLNKHAKIFKITWKHYGKPGFDEDRDSKIFREWALHTGRYVPGDPYDVSTWKTRFRNALHKLPEVEEIPSSHELEGNDPYRVYRFRTQQEIEKIKNEKIVSSELTKPPAYIPVNVITKNYAFKEIHEMKQNALMKSAVE